MTDVVLSGVFTGITNIVGVPTSSVIKTSCWNFDAAAKSLQCFSAVTGSVNGTVISTPSVSPYFDAGINFYIKSQYLWLKAAHKAMCNVLMTNQWSDSGEDGGINGLQQISCIDTTVISIVAGNTCGSMSGATYMVNDTSPYALICSFVRYHDPTSAYGDFPVILLYVDGTNKGGSGTECFGGTGYLMFTPNTAGDGDNGGRMEIVPLEKVVANQVQFGIISNSSAPKATSSQNVSITGQEVVINYMDSTRVYPQPVCMIPTTPNWAPPGDWWSAAWTTSGYQVSQLWGMAGNPDDGPAYDAYANNTGLRFGLFNTIDADVGWNRSFSYLTNWDAGASLYKSNTYATDSMTFTAPLDDSSVYSTILFQLVVSPWYKRSADTYFPPSAGLAANPAGFHELTNNTANAITCQFAVTGVATPRYDTSTYQKYTYTLTNAYTKQILLQPGGQTVTVNYKILTDSNLSGGAITITDTGSGVISYGEPLCICQSRRLEGNAVLGSFEITGNQTVVVHSPNSMCFNTTELYMYYHDYDAAAQQTIHMIDDVNLEFANNTGVEVDFASNGKTTAAVISAGATYAIPFNAAAFAQVPFTLAGVSYTLTASLTSAGIPVISFPVSAPFTATVSPTPTSNWAYGVSLTTSAFAQLDLTEAFNDLAYLSPGSTLQLSGTTIYTESEGNNKTATTAGVALTPGQTYYVNPPALSTLSVTYSFVGGGTVVFTNAEGANFLTTTSEVPAFKNRVFITQAENGSRVLSVTSCSLKNETAAMMYVNIPTPWSTTSAVRKVALSAGTSIQVSANDLAYLVLTFT